MDGRRSNSRTAQVAPEGRPLGPGGSRLLLTHLHIVILKQEGNYLQDIIFKPEKKACNIVLSQDPKYPENKSLDTPPEVISIKKQTPTKICNQYQKPHKMEKV